MKTLVVAVAILAYQTMAASESNHLVSKGLNEFANKLYKEVAKEWETVLVAPISLHEALTQLLQDARGKTSRELAAVLSFGGNGTGTNLQRQEEYRSWLTELQGDGLDISSKLFPVSKSFLEDFAIPKRVHSLPEQWIKEKIRTKKNNLVFFSAVGTGLVANQTALFAANVVTFNSIWKTAFSNGVKSQFHPSPQESVEAEFMLCEDEFDFKHDAVLEAKVLKMDYTSEDYSMVFVLPDREDGLPALEDKLAQTDFRTLTHDLYRTEVNVAIPVFKEFVKSFSKDILKRMGINELFDNSTLQGIPSESIYAVFVVQSSLLIIDFGVGSKHVYNGTMASVNEFFSARGGRAVEQFLVDRPFLYFLMHRGTVLIRGRNIVVPMTDILNDI